MKLPEALHAVAALAGAFARVPPHYARALDKAQKVDDLAQSVAVFSCGGWAKRYPVAAYDIGQDAAVYIVDHLLAHGTNGEDAMHDALDLWYVEDIADRLG